MAVEYPNKSLPLFEINMFDMISLYKKYDQPLNQGYWQVCARFIELS